MTTPIDRTTCACPECVACCHRQPGPLAPGDFEAIAAALGEDHATAKAHFWASGGAMVMDTATGRQFRIGSITPRLVRGRCVFLDDADRCRVHAVAPFGCAYFDTHMDAREGQRRGSWMAAQQQDPAYQSLRRELPFATSYRPKGY